MSAPSADAIVALEAGRRKVARQAVVPIPATVLFSLLANPHRHHEIDGSDTVQERVTGPTALAQGDRFSVAMKQYGLPYTITSKVTAFEQDRVLEWRHPAGHKWRWELSPLGPESTQATETWDATASAAYLIFKLMGVPGRNAKGIEQTLKGLQSRAE